MSEQGPTPPRPSSHGNEEQGHEFIPIPRQRTNRGSTPGGSRDRRRTLREPSEPSQVDAIGPYVGMSRFTIVLAIAGTALSSAAVMLYALVVVLKVIWHAFTESGFEVDGAKHLVVDLIEMTDIFLFGMVLYVVGIGMYQLFVSPDITIPGWMRVHSLDDLKTQLINVIAVLLAVSFLAVAVSWTNDRSILYFGLAIATVILALAAYNIAHHKIANDHEAERHDET